MKVAALALVTLALTLATVVASAADLCIYEPCAPAEDGTYALPDLPYPYDSLEPSIDNKTMGFHHDVHFKGYTTKMNKALAEMLQADGTIEERMTSVDVANSDPSSIFFLNNGGGYLNHKMYFATMGPGGSPISPDGPLAAKIDEDFGSYQNMTEELTAAAKSVFGSGWAFLVLDPATGDLSILAQPNQNSPYLQNLVPLLGVDVWEHAYYLKQGPKRMDYVANWWDVVDFAKVEEAYAKVASS